ncbi:MAG: preprotein translocase subunit SecY [Candidatus Magasanikbacteria bacterium CG10_big_fil_rev_8_21_14_0_10_36_16]|uniref:Protein translocase subunit SecY n=1 Tax=Candidatus Magasanikbacteria bacterium CG10_big_fil_rev_8_21_14_0_10_36_16 TaxID=1974645 RepID=A0A2H0TZ23_9BACT|nr:MAG: preprotein translocase subunit SecY [Candidatus Magasanikbacteria bacterium CG10_big_fil_rev_8_21_14_0_10_36_16]
MWEKIMRIWKIKDLRKRILFVMFLFVIFRFTAHIPVPSIDTANLAKFLEGNQVLGLLNLFSGGTMENFSIVMLGIAPYITASIIFQLLGMVIPSLEELTKEGESGQQKINMYTRITTVPLAFLQSFAMIKLLSNSQYEIFGGLDLYRYISIMIMITAGTIFLMWIGELISEKKIGNGISLLIFAGIVAALPKALTQAVINYDPSQLYMYMMFLVMSIVTVVAVVVINEGQRDIPVSYAKQIRGNHVFGGNTSHLPLRLNMAGVIPIIFAISVVLFPSMIAQFFVNGSGFMARVSQATIAIFNNQLIYGIIYFILVFGFTYFYTAVIFQPQKMAENLQQQGAFIPGIRPGKETEKYLQDTMSKLLFSGALFLGVIAILPLIVRALTGSQSLVIGGTSLLIVVSVAIDSAKQIESQIKMHEYDRV